MAVLPDLSQQLAQMQRMIEAQAAEIARLQAARSEPAMRLRYGWKGTVILSGINGKFGLALYKTQWEKVLARRDEIEAFIKAAPDLPSSPDDTAQWQARHPELKPKDGAA